MSGPSRGDDLTGGGGILFCVVARGNTVLARHAACVGNFNEISTLVLARVHQQSEDSPSKMSLTHGEFIYHYSVLEGIIIMAITDERFDRTMAFQFLDSVTEKFHRQFGARAKTAIAFAMNTEFSLVISSEIKRYNSGAASSSRTANKDPDKISSLQSEVEQVKDIMVANIDSIIERGEKLDLLVDKTENLSANSVTFRTTSRNLQRAMWWKNMKLTVGVAVGVVVFLYVIVSLSCGGLAWPKCV